MPAVCWHSMSGVPPAGLTEYQKLGGTQLLADLGGTGGVIDAIKDGQTLLFDDFLQVIHRRLGTVRTFHRNQSIGRPNPGRTAQDSDNSKILKCFIAIPSFNC